MKHKAFFLLLCLCLVPGFCAAAGEVPQRTVAEEADVLASGRRTARQRALARLAVHPDVLGAEKVLLQQFEELRSGQMPPGIWLDLLEAAEKRGTPALNAALQSWNAESAGAADPSRKFRECLEGGDGEAGAAVFRRLPIPGCVRCHAVDGKGGEIGPDLTWLRKSVERQNILESIILPDATMAVGFKAGLLKLKSGEEVSGVITQENSSNLTLTSVEDGRKRVIEMSEIESRTSLPSLMPPHFGTVLTKREIRDLVEYLARGD